MKVKNQTLRKIVKEEIFKAILSDNKESFEPVADDLPEDVLVHILNLLSLLPAAEVLGSRALVTIDRSSDEPTSIEVTVGGSFPNEQHIVDSIIDLENLLNQEPYISDILSLPKESYVVNLAEEIIPDDEEIVSMASEDV